MASDWRERRNARALVRLQRSRPENFPSAVWQHALSRPFIPTTLTRAVESYWRQHPIRADRLARALASRSSSPEGWTWRLARHDDVGLPLGFRTPPAPYRETRYALASGRCCICGQPVFRYGWHSDVLGDGKPNARASWHLCCVAAWSFWNAPSDQVRILKRIQKHRCNDTGKRLLRTAEVDHLTPLYKVWREHRATPWPELLAFWGVPNLRVINREAHVKKCSAEAQERTKSAADLILL